jgi:hypothetical protein
MEEEKDYLLLKWGTLKGWKLKNSPKAFEALKEYNEIGMSMSALLKKDTKRQKELICKMIDSVNGEVQNDWTGEVYENKEDAKKYILNYRK